MSLAQSTVFGGYSIRHRRVRLRHLIRPGRSDCRHQAVHQDLRDLPDDQGVRTAVHLRP
jgi:hypothetical protein